MQFQVKKVLLGVIVVVFALCLEANGNEEAMKAPTTFPRRTSGQPLVRQRHALRRRSKLKALAAAWYALVGILGPNLSAVANASPTRSGSADEGLPYALAQAVSKQPKLIPAPLYISPEQRRRMALIRGHLFTKMILEQTLGVRVEGPPWRPVVPIPSSRIETFFG